MKILPARLFKMTVFTWCISITVVCQQVTPDASKNQELEELKQKVNALAAAFESFKQDNTRLAEILSEASTKILPVGSIVAFAGVLSTVPDNWLPCDGHSVTSAAYPVLWERIKTSWGGTGPNSFNLPDLRGIFLRGVDGGKGRDPDARNRTPNGIGYRADEVGSLQEDAFENHKHLDAGHSHPANGIYKDVFGCGSQCGAVVKLDPNGNSPGNTSSETAKITGAASLDTTHPLRVSTETRVKNAYVYWIIRVK